MWRNKKPHHLVNATKLTKPVSIKPVSKTRKPIIVGIVALFTALLVSGGSIVTTTVTAEALDTYDKVCPVYSSQGDNPTLRHMGGLTTAQIRYLQKEDINKNPWDNKAPNPANTPQSRAILGTFSEAWGHQIQFVGWVPPAVSEGKSVDKRYSNFGQNWTSPGTNPNVEVHELAKAGGLDGVNVFPEWFISDRIWCRTAIAGANASQTLPNLFLNMSKGVYSIVDTVYITVMGGSLNVTEVIGLNTNTADAGSFDELFITQRATQSWTQEIANQIEVALKGPDGLYNTLYLYFLIPMIFIGSIVVIINLVRTKAVKGLTGIVWMIIMIALGTVVLQTPMALPKFIDGAVGTISNTAATAITNASGNIYCLAEDAANDIDRDARAVSCQIWEATIFDSWVSGQFGRNNEGLTFTEAAGTTARFAVIDINGPGFSNAAHAAADKNFVSFFSGEGKTFEAFVGFISITAIGAFILGNAALLIAYQISMLLLIFTAPFFFLIGILPSQSGKGIFLRWVELIVALFVKRLVVTIFMAVFIKMFLLIAALSWLPLIMKTMLFAVLTYIGFSQRGKLIEMFAGKINFGGDKSINVGSSLEKAAEKSGAVAVSAGLAGGAYMGGKAALGTKKLGATGVRQVRRANLDRKLKKNSEDAGKQQQILANYVDKTGDTKKQNQFLNERGKVNFDNFNEKAEATAVKRKQRMDNMRSTMSDATSRTSTFAKNAGRKAANIGDTVLERSGMKFAGRVATNTASNVARKVGTAVANSTVGTATKKAAVFVGKQAVAAATGISEVGSAIGSDMQELGETVKAGTQMAGKAMAEPIASVAGKAKKSVLKVASNYMDKNPDFASEEKYRAAERNEAGKKAFSGVENYKATSPISYRESPYTNRNTTTHDGKPIG